MKRRIVIAALVLAVIAPLDRVPAQSPTVPALINYQGRLVDAEGLPLETANRNLVVNIYDAATGGTKVYGPQPFPQTPVVNGYYNILLGPADESDQQRPIEQAFMGEHRYLEVTVNDEPMSPRQRILSAPYALQSQNAVQAENADTLDGFDWREILLNGGTNPSTTKIDGSNVTRVPEASIAYDLTGTPRTSLTDNTRDRVARRYYFIAKAGAGAGDLTDGTRIRFREELADSGTYDHNAGLFRAQETGLYEFHLYVQMTPNGTSPGDVGVNVIIDGDGADVTAGRFTIHRDHIEDHHQDAIGASFLLKLNEGELVHLIAVGNWRFLGNDHSHYSGRLVYLLE